MNHALSAEQIYEQYPPENKHKLIKLCNKFNIDAIILIKAMHLSSHNDFEYVHNLVELPNFCEKFSRRISKQSLFIDTLHSVVKSHELYNKLKNKHKLKLDKRDVIGLIPCPYGKQFVLPQIFSVLKKYGLSKCILYSNRLTYHSEILILMEAFQIICKNEPIYSMIYQSYSAGYYQRFYLLHKQLLPKIRQYVAFRGGCKLLLSMCEDTQNGVNAMNLPMVNDYVFGNDYLLNRIIRFL